MDSQQTASRQRLRWRGGDLVGAMIVRLAACRPGQLPEKRAESRVPRQERHAERHRHAPADRHDPFQPRCLVRQPNGVPIGPRLKHVVRRQGARTLSPRRPQETQGPRFAVLLVVDAEAVNARFQPERPRLRVHPSRRPAPYHPLAVDPNVEAVVAGAVQLELARLGQIPEPVPPDAEEPPGQRRILAEEVQRDSPTDIDPRYSAEADIRVHLTLQADSFRHARIEDK